MSLKLRTLFAVGSLLLVFLLSAAGAALGFHELASAVRDVLAENYRSVVAAHDMIIALDDENAAVLAILIDPTLESRQALSAAAARFAEALAIAERNVTIEGEEHAVGIIRSHYGEWAHARDTLLADPGVAPLEQYRRVLRADFEALRAQVGVLVDLNHVAMIEGDQRAFELARRRAGLSTVLVAVAILGAALLWRTIRLDLLDRLAELESVANAVATGQPRRASVARVDELGAVASALNRALDQEEATRLRSKTDLGARSRLLVALLRVALPHAVLLGASGELFASCTPVGEEVAEAVRQRLRQGSEIPDELEIEASGTSWRLRRLRHAEGTVVGWLAEPHTAGVGTVS